MNACTNPHDSKLRHWYRAKARHAEPEPKYRLHNIRAIRAERMRRFAEIADAIEACAEGY